MCGRTACTLAPDALQKACRYCCKRSGAYREPKWAGGNDGEGDKSNYYPSYNVCPQNRTPVLVKGNSDDVDRILQTMKWGLIPSWHRGDPSTFGYNMSNARLDTLLEKASFKKPMVNGQRCVVLADGFFEWKSVPGSKKQPYFVYFKDGGDVEGKDGDVKLEGKGITSRLLTMAGLFDVWTSSSTDDTTPLYSYTIITVDASPSIKWLHHRMPAILDGEEAVSRWLDYGEYNTEKALSMLTPVDSLSWHPVSTVVNDARNKREDCVKKIDLNSPKPKQETVLTQWLKKSSSKRPPPHPSPLETAPCKSEHNAPPGDDDDEEPLAKKQK
ncbi:abasic site processing protein HMCES-like isoform X2 [Corticium candelabrum]|uniref:abasic site processing protein HMCES-like isoform X2 n=1 Tax=Corticium candelabrum TaxID=121492 RepID=UPI002E25FFDE|nr:abasic site processing protein HMCES-like isoform X2 [Corticium candelabrum]